ncbi:Ig-like domain-containing protein [Acetoanaerobium noterae]|uniref:Ig-like domain-containing protein n=1 Tax=Acetoanaerobium noterae TaxID=745369 RepID=UPI003241F0D4
MRGKIQKKGLALLLALVMVLSLMPAVTMPVYAATDATFDFEGDTSPGASNIIEQTVNGETIHLYSEKDVWTIGTEIDTVGSEIPIMGGKVVSIGLMEATPLVKMTVNGVKLFTLDSFSFADCAYSFHSGNIIAKTSKGQVDLSPLITVDDWGYADFTLGSNPVFQDISYVELVASGGASEGAWLALDNISLKNIHTPTGSYTATASASTAMPAVGVQDVITLTVKNELGNTDVNFDGDKTVTITGYEEAPNGTYGSFNGTTLEADGSTDVMVTFTDGVGAADLKLNKAASQSIGFSVSEVTIPTTNNITIAPTHGTAASMAVTQDITAPSNNGDNFAQQPKITLKDDYGNICSSNNSTVVTVAKKDAGSWSLTGTTTATAISGVATFTGLGATNTTAVSNARLGFTSGVMNEVTSTTVNLPAPAPTVTSVSVPSNAIYISGQNLDFTVNFSENVTVNTAGGTPYILITLNTGGPVNAAYQSGSGTSALVFRYTVQSGNYDADGIAVGASITANGGTIKEATGTNVNLTLNGVGATTSVLVDAIAPTVTSVSVPSNATYIAGQNLDFTVNFSENVTVNTAGGTPYIPITLNTGGPVNAAYQSGSGTSALVFRYTVQSGNYDADGIAVGASVTANGGTLKDATGNNATLTLNSVGATTSIFVDTAAPTVSILSPADNATNIGVSSNLVITFDENVVKGTGNIVIKKTSDNSTVETIDVTSGQVTGGGTATITINPAATLAGETEYYVQIDATAFDDTAGNSYAGIANTTSWSFTTTDSTAPTVTSVSVPSNATYISGQNLDFTVNFSENVTVNTAGGTPYIPITLNTGGTVNAAYQSGSGTSALVFRYTVQSGNYDADGITVGASITANGGTLKDATGNNATLTLNSVGATTSVLVDAIAPTVTSVSVPSNAIYIAGQNLDFTVNFSENVTVNTAGGTPYIPITLNTGGPVNAAYQSGSGTSALVFRYTVQSGNYDADGITVGASITANGGTLKDATGNNATLTLNSVGATTSVLVDAIAPTVTSVSVPSNATYIAGQNLDFTVNFSENVTVNTAGGTPYIPITLNTGGPVNAAYQSGSGTSALVFRYTVQSGNYDADGITVGASITANGGTLKDATGNNATLTLNSVGATTSVLVDAIAPTVTSVSVPSNATYIAGQNLDFTVNFSENVTVNTAGGTPYIPITLNTGGPVNAAYQSGSGTSALVFRYTVQSGNYDADGIAVGASVTANGGTLKDATGNNATLTLNSVGATTSIFVDTAAPTVSILSPADNATNIGVSSNLVITFDENVVKGTGNIVIKKTSDNSTVETIDVTSGQVTGGGTATITINPAATLAGETEYYVQIDATAFDDTAGNSYAGIANTTSWNFTTGTLSTPSGGGGGGSSTSGTGTVKVVVNGKTENAGTEMNSTENGKTVVTVAVNNSVIKSKIEEAVKTNTTGQQNVIQVPVADTKSDVVKVELTGDIVKQLETNTFDVSVKRDAVEYIIPAKELTISNVAKELGVAETSLKDIKVEVQIIKLDDSVVAKYNEVAKENGATIIFPPTAFEVVAKTTNAAGKTEDVKISKFSNYVERVMEIPAGVDPSKITTGIVFNEDGTYSHVPTEVYQKDGKWYAKLNSLTNSNYSVVWNPVTVNSVEKHWAKNAVNDMASRLVIFNADTFEPNKAITRADFAEYIVRALGLYRQGEHQNKFTDINAKGDRTLAILIANEYGIVTGYSDGTFRGDNQITREEAMTMYQRAMKITKLTGSDTNRINTYVDSMQVSKWAVSYVTDVLSAHVFNGTTAKTIAPKANLTYAEAAQAIKNLLVQSGLIN